MRTATDQTRRALKAAIGDAPGCVSCGLIADYYDAAGLCPLCSPEFDEEDPSKSRRKCKDAPVTVLPPPILSDLQKAAQEAIQRYGGLRPAARALSAKVGEPVNHAILAMALKGKDFPKARRVLGLPMKAIPVEPCPSCGRIHRQYKSCDPAPGKQRKPNKRRARLNELAQQAGYETWGKLETAVLYGRAKVIQEGD